MFNKTNHDIDDSIEKLIDDIQELTQEISEIKNRVDEIAEALNVDEKLKEKLEEKYPRPF